MEYINPGSLAGMAQGPQGSMLPGTGAGPLDVVRNNQALQQSYDFLDMAKAAQAQDYVQNQWKMQTAHDQYGLDKQAKELSNRGEAQKIRAGEQGMKISDEKIKALRQSGELQKMSFIGSLSEPWKNAQSPMERVAILKQARQAYSQMFPEDQSGLQDFDTYNPGQNPNADAEFGQHFANAQHISTYADQSMNQKSGLLGQEYGYKSGMQGKQIQSNEGIAKAERAKDIEVANIMAAARKATEGGGNALSKLKADVAGELIDAATALKEGKTVDQLTPRQRAILEEGPKLLAPTVINTELAQNPENRGAIAKEQSKQGIQGALEAVGRGNSSSVQAPLPTPKNAPQNYPTQVQGRPPTDEEHMKMVHELKNAGQPYDDTKWDYSIGPGGEILRRPKGK